MLSPSSLNADSDDARTYFVMRDFLCALIGPRSREGSVADSLADCFSNELRAISDDPERTTRAFLPRAQDAARLYQSDPQLIDPLLEIFVDWDREQNGGYFFERVAKC